jgi:hypothetical protein
MFAMGDHVQHITTGKQGMVYTDEDGSGQVMVTWDDDASHTPQIGPAAELTLIPPVMSKAEMQDAPVSSALAASPDDLALAYARTSGTLTGALRVIDIEARVCLNNYDVGDSDPRNKALEFIHAYCLKTLRENSDS